MLLAEVGSMQPQLIDGVVMPELEPVATVRQLVSQLAFAAISGIIRHVQSTLVCPVIPEQTSGQSRYTKPLF
ncbi:hypothetical protein CV739_24660 [Bacillus velezensis]|nr:hypothetical protein CV739_24660 [Bacillus velezensis]